MCDTMVAMGNSTRDGRILMAKNSDRHPNEPHIVIYQPPAQYPVGSKLHCTYLELDQAAATNAVLMLKPAWLWGCEMGANEFGLNIGNEAVFTREPIAATGLTGMDMIRLALERCHNSEEALDYMVELLARYGQGGNCGYGRRFLYHNSFIIADPRTAWVLETAGEYWVAAQVDTTWAISNRLTIGQNFDRSHPRVIEHAIQKGWCRSSQDFDFARCYTNPLITKLTGSKERLSCSLHNLSNSAGYIDENSLRALLRSHHPADQASSCTAASVRSVCMHAGGLIGDHTTGSYIASLGTNDCSYWVTGSSTPCLSVFKPLWFDLATTVVPSAEGTAQALDFWYQREHLHRAALQGHLPDAKAYLDERDQLEQKWLAAVGARRDNNNDADRSQLLVSAWQEEARLVNDTLKRIAASKPWGNWKYRSYWKWQTRNLIKEQQHPRIF